MIAVPVKSITTEEYLTIEVESETRNEYKNGEITPMTGGMPNHNELIRALTVLLSALLRSKNYQLFLTDQRLWIPDRNIYTYPDIMVMTRPIQLQAGRKDTVINPILIVEVLSESTQNYDRGEKFAHYRTIGTFQEYLLIDQYSIHVEQYVKQGPNQWLFTEYSGLEEHLDLTSIGGEITLRELYEGVEF